MCTFFRASEETGRCMISLQDQLPRECMLRTAQILSPALRSLRQERMESRSVAQAGVQWCNLDSLQTPPPGLKDGVSSCGQAGLELLTSSHPPALASPKCWDDRREPPCLAYDDKSSKSSVLPLPLLPRSSSHILLPATATLSPWWLPEFPLAASSLDLPSYPGVTVAQAGCGGMTTAPCSLCLPGSGNPSASAAGLVGTTGMPRLRGEPITPDVLAPTAALLADVRPTWVGRVLTMASSASSSFIRLSLRSSWERRAVAWSVASLAWRRSSHFSRSSRSFSLASALTASSLSCGWERERVMWVPQPGSSRPRGT
ncbi:hypothetical protein AAY473_025399 [Plecturocebus cupreus]